MCLGTTVCLTTMHYRSLTFGQFIVAFILVVLAQGDYVIDDSNSTVQYPGFWTRADIVSLNSSKVYDGTV